MRTRFRLWLVKWLTRLLLWLNPPLPQPEVVPAAPAAPDPFMVRVAELVADAENLPTSGEAKRHQVYARLLKEFPSKRRRDVAYAIEKVLQG